MTVCVTHFCFFFALLGMTVGRRFSERGSRPWVWGKKCLLASAIFSVEEACFPKPGVRASIPHVPAYRQSMGINRSRDCVNLNDLIIVNRLRDGL